MSRIALFFPAVVVFAMSAEAGDLPTQDMTFVGVHDEAGVSVGYSGVVLWVEESPYNPFPGIEGCPPPYSVGWHLAYDTPGWGSDFIFPPGHQIPDCNYDLEVDDGLSPGGLGDAGLKFLFVTAEGYWVYATYAPECGGALTGFIMFIPT